MATKYSGMQEIELFDAVREQCKKMSDDLPKSDVADGVRSAVKNLVEVMTRYMDYPEQFKTMISHSEKSAFCLRRHLDEVMDELAIRISAEKNTAKKIAFSKLLLSMQMLPVVVDSVIKVVDAHLVEFYGGSDKYTEVAEMVNPLAKLISMFNMDMPKMADRS